MRRGKSQRKAGWVVVGIRVAIVLLLIGVFVVMVIGPAQATDNRPRDWSGPCTVRAHPGINGDLLEQESKFLDVYDVPGGGYFISEGKTYNWDAWGQSGSRIRFGVSTKWALIHPGWEKVRWDYVYNNGCDREKGY